MSELTTQGRKRIAEGNFALPGRRYPIHDRAHARNALARIAQRGTAAEKKQVQAAVHAKYPNIGDEKTAGMEKEALWPLLIPAAAAALPMLGLLRHNPTLRYNIGGQRYNSFNDALPNFQEGDVVITRHNQGLLPSKNTIQGHADVLFRSLEDDRYSHVTGQQDPAMGRRLDAILVPMKTDDFEGRMGEEHPTDPLAHRVDWRPDIAHLRPDAPAHEVDAFHKDIQDYASKIDAYDAAMSNALKKRYNQYKIQFDPNANAKADVSKLRSAFKGRMQSGTPSTAAGINDILGFGPGADPSKDPLAIRFTQTLKKLENPDAFAEEMIGKSGIDALFGQRTDEIPFQEIVDHIKKTPLLDDCPLGRCTTAPAYFANKHFTGGSGIDKPLEHIAPADFLYSKRFKPVGYSYQNRFEEMPFGRPPGGTGPGGTPSPDAPSGGFGLYFKAPKSPSRIFSDPNMKARIAASAVLGGTAALGTGLAAWAMKDRRPWHKRFRSHVVAGEYSKAGKALREGAMLAIKKLGLR